MDIDKCLPDNLSNEMLHLLHKLEYLLGSEFYNGNIQNYGPRGQWEGEGRDFRYPVRFVNSDGKIDDYKGELPFTLGNDGEYGYCLLTPGHMDKAHYAFGANHLFVFRGLIKILEHLERRFGISFEDLLEKESKERD